MSAPGHWYCPTCHMAFGAPREVDGHVRCPICRTARTDGFNQLDPGEFECTVCFARIGGTANTAPSHCPNDPHSKNEVHHERTG